MAHNPVQVVLNTKDYFEVPELTPGGSRKDFFEDRDREFVAHKSRLIKQITSIESVLRHSDAKSGFVKVALQKEALAKSHRPVRSLFPENEFPTVGAGKLGEVYYHVSAAGIDRIQRRIESAEVDTRKKMKKNGDLQANPSQARSEVGAIKSITIPEASDKRTFGVDEALKWLRDKRTAGFYVVQLFDVPTRRHSKPEIVENIEHLRAEFIKGLIGLRLGIEIYPFAPRSLRTTGKLGNTFLLRLTKTSPTLSEKQLRRWSSEGTESTAVDLTRQHHERLLGFLDEHPLARRVTLSPIVVSSKHSTLNLGKSAALPEVDSTYSYPRIGVIDGGISDVLSSWIVGRNDLIDSSLKDSSHGTFVAGLLVGGKSLNTEDVAPEADGCELYDIGLLPDENVADAFTQYYPRGILDFLAELENSVTSARQDRVRVFNMSLNLQDPVEEEQYSPFAAYLDRIADENDALFVISAGNLEATDIRPVWPADCKEALKQLAARTSPDTIFQPAESARSVSVGAINPPGTTPCVAGTPANYSRRGPGLKVGVKPDFAHYGGSLPSKATTHHGLFSIATDGTVTSGAGTSYSAPLVAKTLAILDAGIEGQVPRETLIALSVHNAQTPTILAVEELRDINRQFIGFGIPPRAADMLTTDDSRITLVFSDVLQKDSELRFGFVWPRSLTTDAGACRGRAKMTLVYRPPLDDRFGSEFVRVNLDAYLRQENPKDGRFKGRLQQIFLPNGATEAQFEVEQIEHGLKWWPTKVYEKSFKRGVGTSSNWQLVIDSIRRASEAYPSAGIPFTLVVTISDLDGQAPVFPELRQDLRSRQVEITDIKVASRIRLRG